jgi:iron complex outermembrane receptor protein
MRYYRTPMTIAMLTILYGNTAALAADRPALEEVIVTAQKRSESAQDIPLALTTLGADLLEQRGITDIASLVSSVPGMHFGQAGANTRITIRGIGTEQTTVTGDPGVAFHIDGVYQARSSAANALFYDLQRVEVLRGPQGTLYGRNATGGSVNLISKAPVNEVEGNLELQLGDYNQQRLRAVYNTPLVDDKLLMRISAQKETRDGFYEDLGPSADDLQDVDGVDIRAQFAYQASDSFDARLIYNFATAKGAGFGRKGIGAYPTGSPLPVNVLYQNATPNPADPWKINYNDLAKRDNRREGVTLEMNWDLEWASFKSISAWQDNTVDFVRDFDLSDADIVNENNIQDSTQFSQELQLSSNGDGALEWIVGLYWLSEESNTDYWLNDMGAGLTTILPTIDVGLANPVFFGNDSTTEVDSLGAFGQASYNFSDSLKLTGGIRYSKDEKKSDIFRKGFASPVSQEFEKEGDWDDVTWKLGLDWFVTEESLLYTNLSTGFKSGGFLQQLNAENYDPEEITAFEVGSKNRFLDNSLEANFSAFYYDYTDMQLSTIRNLQRETTNAGEAEIKGLEVELVAQPTSALRLTGTFAYTDAKFTEYVDRDPQEGRGAAVQDLSGNSLPRAPEYTANLSAAYSWDFDLGSLTASMVYYWSDEAYFSAFNRDDAYQESYHRTDARLAFESTEGDWYVAIAANNLEDDEIASQVELANPQLGGVNAIQWQAPRTVTLSVGYNFD